MGLLPEEQGVLGSRAFLQFLGRLIPIPILQEEADAAQTQIDIIFDFQDFTVLAQGFFRVAGLNDKISASCRLTSVSWGFSSR